MASSASELKDRIDSGEYRLVVNSTAQAACWSNFRLILNDKEEIIKEYCCCTNCHRCILFKKRTVDGKYVNFGTKNLIDHIKGCTGSLRKQKNSSVEKNQMEESVKRAFVRFVCQTGLPFQFIDHVGFRSFAQEMLRIGSEFGSSHFDRAPLRQEVVQREAAMQADGVKAWLKRKISTCFEQRAVAYTTDFVTDDASKKSYLDLAFFLLEAEVGAWKLTRGHYASTEFSERPTAEQVRSAINRILFEAGCNPEAAPCTTGELRTKARATEFLNRAVTSSILRVQKTL